MKKSKIATIVMFACVALFIALFITFFVVGDSFKATFNDLSVKIAGLGAGDAELKAQYEAQQAGVNVSYTVCAVISYVSSILALASVGVGLAVSDKFKEAEEKAAEAGQ